MKKEKRGTDEDATDEELATRQHCPKCKPRNEDTTDEEGTDEDATDEELATRLHYPNCKPRNEDTTDEVNTDEDTTDEELATRLHYPNWCRSGNELSCQHRQMTVVDRLLYAE
ncbi:hypothetical protein ScPMuIL_013942 [Solemya velum]